MTKKEMSDKELLRILGIDQKTLDMFKNVRQKAIAEAKQMSSRNNRKIVVLGISGSARDLHDMAQEASNSEELLRRCLKHCSSLGAKTELISLRDYDIKHCKACYSTVNTQCHYPCSCYAKGTPTEDDMTKTMYDKIYQADVILFATPVNNFKISTLMATFIDRCISMDGSLSPADPKNPKNKSLNIKHMRYIELTSDNNVPGSGLLRRFLGKTAGIIVTGHEEGASMAITQLFMALNHFGMLFPPFSNMYAMASVCNATYEDKKMVLGGCYEDEVRLLAENVMRAAEISKGTKPTDWKYEYKSN